MEQDEVDKHDPNINNESVEEAVYRFVRDIDFPDTQSELTWSNKWYLDLQGSANKKENSKVSHSHNEFRLHEDNIHLSRHNELLLRDISPLSTTAELTKSTQDVPISTSQRIRNFHEVLPKFSTVRQRPKFSGNFNKLSEIRRPKSFDTIVQETITDLHIKIPNANATKLYSKDEDEIIDTFIGRYCQYENITLSKFKAMMWSNGRKRSHPLTLFWKAVYKIFAYRSHTSLYGHIRRKHHRFDKYGTWNEEDDKILSELCNDEKLSGKWSQIGNLMKRMPEDCRDRWRNYIKLEGKQRKSRWSPDEEKKLQEIIDKYGNDQNINWVKISEMMGGTRSRLQCRYKWSQMKKIQMIKEVQTLTKERLRQIFEEMKRYLHVKDLKSQEMNWEELANTINCHKSSWTAAQLQIAYDEWKRQVPSYKNMSMKEVISCIINILNK